MISVRGVTRAAVVAAMVLLAAGTAQAVVIDTVPVSNTGNTGELSGTGAGGHGPDRICGPVNYVSWYDTLRFANWLHNGQLTSAQGPSTTEDGAYEMSPASNVLRKSGARWVLPTEDEWYKAAYHKNDGVTGNKPLTPGPPTDLHAESTFLSVKHRRACPPNPQGRR